MDYNIVAVDENGNIIGEDYFDEVGSHNDDIKYEYSVRKEFGMSIYNCVSISLVIILVGLIVIHFKRSLSNKVKDNNLSSIISELCINTYDIEKAIVYSGTRNLLTIKYKKNNSTKTNTFEIKDIKSAIEDITSNGIEMEFIGKEEL